MESIPTIQQFQVTLLRSNLVQSGVVRSRQTSEGGEAWVAYVVSVSFNPSLLDGWRHQHFPNHPIACHWVSLAALPLTPTGDIDEAALATLEILEPEVGQQWETQLNTIPKIVQAAVVCQDVMSESTPWHLSDLLPHWHPRAGGTDTLVEGHVHETEDLSNRPLALSEGAPLTLEADDPQRLHEVLVRAARDYPQKGIIYYQEDGTEKRQTYPELLEAAQRVLTGLRRLGLHAGDPVIFQIARNEDYIPTFWGCVLGGIIPLGISVSPTYREDNGIVTKVYNLWERLNRPLILSGPQEIERVRELASFKQLDDFRVESVEGLRHHEPSSEWHPSQPEDLALFLLTSGSTGLPKIVCQTHSTLIHRSKASAQINGFQEQDIDLNWLPIDHVTGIVMSHLRDVYVGAKEILVPTEWILQHPLHWLDLIDRYRATIIWAPNFAFRLIASEEEQVRQGHWDLSSVRFAENAGEPIVAKSCRRFLTILGKHGLSPDVMKPAWGMAETCSTVTVSNRFTLEETTDQDAFVDLGVPFPGFSMRIVNDQGEVLREGEVGHLQCKGATVLPEYYQNPKANAESFTEERWFNTGDLAYLKQGCLTLTGRGKDVIIVNGMNYYGHEIETAVEELEGIEVSYTAAIAVWDPVHETDSLAVLFHTPITAPAALIDLLDRVRHQAMKFGLNPSYLVPVEKEDIPKTGIGKIQRSQIQKRFNAGAFDANLKRVDLLTYKNSLPAWFYQTVWHPKNPETLTRSSLSGPLLVFAFSEKSHALAAALLEVSNTSLASATSHTSFKMVLIESGERFEEITDQHYQLNPQDPVHYHQLLGALANHCIPTQHILHLGGYGTPTTSATEGLAPYLHLVEALAQIHQSEQTIHWTVVTQSAQAAPHTSQLHCNQAPLAGFVKSVSLDLPWLQGVHVDLERIETHEALESHALAAQHVLAELEGVQGDPEVAYRQGQRWVAGLAPVSLPDLPAQELPFQQGGFYLITGGLGGVGATVASSLLSEYQAKLLVIGRTELPSRDEWDTLADSDSPIAQKIRTFQDLERCGGVLRYERVDVANTRALIEVVHHMQVEQETRLLGILHFAGTLIQEPMWGSGAAKSIYEQVFHAKVAGTQALFEMLQEVSSNPVETLFIGASSVASVFGSSASGSYAAANAYLDAFIAWMHQQGYQQAYGFNWSAWYHLGLSAHYSESIHKSIRNLGYHLIDKEQGLHSLMAALHRKQTSLIIGVEGEHPRMQALIPPQVSDMQTVSRQQWVGYCETHEVWPEAALQQLQLQDAFGSTSRCRFQPITEWPRLPNGELDREALQYAGIEAVTAADYVIPRNELESTLAHVWQKVLHLDRKISIHDNFFDLGGNSLLTAQVQAELEQVVKQPISMVALFQYPTISTLAEHLHGAGASPGSDSVRVRRRALPSEGSSDIAIVGMAGRFPGARNVAEFWNNLVQGIESITPLMDEEIHAAGISPELYRDPHYVKAASVLDEVDHFDMQFFGYSPTEARIMDPQQRFLLECAWEALEDAGYDPFRYDGAIGVFGGSLTSTHLLFNVFPYSGYIQTEERIQNLLGNATDCLPTRISYKLNLKGPSVNVQTNCSTSLVAVHLACQSLLNGESDLALAGGAAIRFPQKTGYRYREGSLSSPDGHCRPFDAEAGGTLFGDGVAIVALKRLDQAVEDGDAIHAVIKGTAINNDGSDKIGFTAPSVEGQMEVIRMAQAEAAVPVDTITYVEAHGTGTKMGDPIEVQALTQAFRTHTEETGFCAIGSVKSNIGHLESAAGATGLIKTVLAMKHQTLPGTLHFQNPNPRIDFASSPFYVQSQTTPWNPKGVPRRAAISSFGLGGTNAHAILEEAPESPVSPPSRAFQLFLLSAKTPEALPSVFHRLAQHCQNEPLASLADAAYTLQVGRSHFPYRSSVVADSSQGLIAQLNELVADMQDSLSEQSSVSEQDFEEIPARYCDPNQRPSLVFMFPGSGSQYINMGRGLYGTEPLFREEFDRCADCLKTQHQMDLVSVLFTETESSQATEQLAQVEWMQPSVFAIEYALAKLLMAWGITPQAMIGHSLGEYTAACLAGVFTMEEALTLVVKRSQLMKTVPPGAMLVVPLPETEMGPYLSDTVSLATVNSSRSSVVSGTPEAISQLEADLLQQGVEGRRVRVSVAMHSAMLDPILEEFAAAVAKFQLQPPQVPYVSNVTGTWVTAEQATDPNYWAYHLRHTVYFGKGLDELLQTPHRLFVEVGPGHTLTNFVGQHPDRTEQTLLLPTLRHRNSSDADEAFLLNTLGQLWQAGVLVDWDAFYREESRCRVHLPTYPFQRESCESERPALVPSQWGQASASMSSSSKDHLLLSDYFMSSLHVGTTYWELELSPALFPYLRDHVLLNEIVFPGAGYMEIAMAAAKQRFGQETVQLRNFHFRKALFLEEEKTTITQLTLRNQSQGKATFRFSSLQPGTEHEAESWTLHCEGDMTWDAAEDMTASASVSISEVQQRCSDRMTHEQFYENMVNRGVQYGPAFKGIDKLWRNDTESLCHLDFPESLTFDPFVIHPALLDICFQATLGSLPTPQEGDATSTEQPYFPIHIDRLCILDDPEKAVWAYARDSADLHSDEHTLIKDVWVMDDQGSILLEIEGFRLERLETQDNVSHEWQDFFYRLAWQAQPWPSPHTTSHAFQGTWLIFSDYLGVGNQIAERLQAAGGTPILVKHTEQDSRFIAPDYRINPTVPEDFVRLQESLGTGHPLTGVLHLWNLDHNGNEAPDAISLDRAHSLGPVSLLHTVHLLDRLQLPQPPRLWVVTRRAQVVDVVPDPTEHQPERIEHQPERIERQPERIERQPETTESGSVEVAQAPVWGFTRVIHQEHPEWRCTTIDVGLDTTHVWADSLFQELQWNTQEDQVAWRGGQRYVLRLQPHHPEMVPQELVSAAGCPFQLLAPETRVLNDLVLQEIAWDTPGPGEVQIAVDAIGINFTDVMMAMGIMPGVEAGGVVPWTGELSGRIVAVGQGVAEFQPDDAVIAFASGIFGSSVTISTDYVTHQPKDFHPEEGATVLVAFLTAYYGLDRLANLKPGERVLIHAAAGGVGLAAVQVAQQRSAEVFATAGSHQKREYLRAMGIRHVMDSRSLDFADQVKAATQGEGVDVILNSLSGEAIAKNFEILAPLGRFVELGVRDIALNNQLDMKPFERDLSYFAFSLKRISRRRPKLFKALLEEVMVYFHKRIYFPLPYTDFPVSDVADAFRYMSQSKHFGKVVVRMQDPKAQMRPHTEALSSEATYLITGGLSGLGLSFAEWMVEQGAKHLVLIGRRGATPEAEPTLQKLREVGAQIHVFQADVSQAAQLESVFETIRLQLPPLRGILHAAGLLDDSTLVQMNAEQFKNVMAPKVTGAWNLHRFSVNASLDWFVCFSSVASILGNAGQGNYAAANAFLDGLAHYRRSLGLPALTINWGSWAKIGMAAASGVRGARLAAHGLGNLEPHQGIHGFETLLRESIAQTPMKGTTLAQDSVPHIPPSPQLTVMDFNVSQWVHSFAGAQQSGLFRELHQESATKAPRASMHAELGHVEPEQREAVLQAFLRKQICQVLGLSTNRLKPNTPLNTMGLDSLMSIELRNRLESNLGIRVNIVNFIRGTTLSELTQDLLAEWEARQESQPSKSATMLESVDLTPPPIPSTAAQAEYPISYSQQMCLLLEERGGVPYYNAPIQFTFHGNLDVTLLEQSLQHLMRRHAILRAYLTENHPKALQRIADSYPVRIPVVDLRDRPWSERRKACEQHIEDTAKRRFDLTRPPLFRGLLVHMDANHYECVLVFHHVLVDGWSLGILREELEILYRALVHGCDLPEDLSQGFSYQLPHSPSSETIRLEPMAVDYKDFACWEHSWMQGPILDAHLAYWTQQLADVPVLLELPTDHIRPMERVTPVSHHRQVLPQVLYEQIKTLGQAHEATPFMVMMTALKIVMYGWTAQDDIVIGTSSANRNNPETRRMMGCFYSPLPLRSRLHEALTGKDLLEQLKAAWMELQTYQSCPFGPLMQAIHPQHVKRYEPVCNVYFAMQSFDIFQQTSLSDHLESQMALGATLNSSYDLHLMALPEALEDGVLLTWDYHHDLFHTETVDAVAALYHSVLERLVDEPHLKVTEFPRLG